MMRLRNKIDYSKLSNTLTASKMQDTSNYTNRQEYSNLHGPIPNHFDSSFNNKVVLFYV
jgi:hypothetical protein